MKRFRVLFWISIAQMLMGFTCSKQNGAQINTYKISSCPSLGYDLPNFAENQDRILTQDPKSRFKCDQFKPYTVMEKEGISTNSWNFLAKIVQTESGCSLKIAIPNFCGRDDTCARNPVKFDHYLPDHEIVISNLLLDRLSISITEHEDSEILSEARFKESCRF